MCLNDFLRLSHESFQEVYKQYLEGKNQSHKLRMEENRVMLVKLVNLSPWYEDPLDPVEVWPFPWDQIKEESKSKPGSSEQRMNELADKWK